MSNIQSFKFKTGFTLIEMIIFIFIFSISSMTFYKSFASGTVAMGNVKSRLDALAIANEKMEIIHNLDYEKIGTKHGVFTGEIEDSETVTQDNKSFWVYTKIKYVDDAFDKTAAEGDSKPNDYKQINIQVYWEDGNPSKSVTLNGMIAPPGIESIYTGGILSLHVVDNNGNGIEGASVNITNNSLSPIVNINNLHTDSDGNIFLIEARASNNYHISVAKAGYFPVQTYAPYPQSSVLPVDLDASVVEGNINQKTIVTDQISSLKISTTDPFGTSIPNIEFGLTGGRKIADTYGSNSLPVFAYDQPNLATDTQGQKNFSDLSSGPYTFIFKTATANDNFELIGVSAATSAINKFEISPNTAAEINVILADKNTNSLLVNVVDRVDSVPIVGAAVQLKQESSGFDVTLPTDKFGRVFFPNTSEPLASGDYEIIVKATGFVDSVPQTVSVDKLTKQTISLTAN